MRELIDELEERVLRVGRPAPLACSVDGKALPVGTYSHDKHARWGRGTGVWAKGYKLHLLLSITGTVIAWRLSPMSGDEREMARRMLKSARCSGYILGDKEFDANYLYEEAARHGGQLVTPRLKGARRGLGHRRQAKGRLRSKDLLENGISSFGRQLWAARAVIERRFGYLASTGGLLTHLPAWVRTYPRVRRWVQTKMIIAELRAQARHRALAA